MLFNILALTDAVKYGYILIRVDIGKALWKREWVYDVIYDIMKYIYRFVKKISRINYLEFSNLY